ncbi:MAG: cytochrome c oxidase subunit II [Xanthomonadales bacterium]|nr:cytochrome c oxidase subunit II [Xanthomonadales bacterium]NIN60501.1 cytochrome c oxidase subunit II [Xanthomonadales bacterium]NIN75856.1 cytochrome c oxidase subunit II [Xanthomonadales bacterium]NIO15246.1 cytochrome c oxidase subunit II [Xanthomonadales bacterium]NIP12894.1 cytochrome c oxidase subunit II [Xanthomonadales bacterium]
MNRANTVIITLAVLAAVAAAFWLLLAAPALTGNEINMPVGVTAQSAIHYELHMVILKICVVIGVLVFGAMFTSIVLHRKSRGHRPAEFSHNTSAEIVWTIIPVLILISMAIPATTALVKMEDASGADLTIKVTGFQWKWKYEYLDEEVAFISALSADSNAARQLRSGIDPATVDNYLLDVDHPLVLPVGKKVRFLITADDVIHAWWVPDFGWKRDAIPGFVNEAWTLIEQPGTYRGQCAELCGKDHGFMPIVVEALPEPEFQAWLAAQKTRSQAEAQTVASEWTTDRLLERGRAVYATHCATCHQEDGGGLAPAFPALAGSPVSTGPLQENIRVVLEGREGTAMQAFGDLLSATDIAAALTYTRNAFGNDTGDVVQPRTIAETTQH